MSGRYPIEPFPVGWFAVAYGDEVTPGSAIPLRYFGQDLVCTRGEDGRARLFDAYCPHLGAHIGHGGCSRGDRLVCPFHGWEFAPDGSVVAIPYTDGVNRQARLQAWEVEEAHGLVFAWYAPDDRRPEWRPSDVSIPELTAEEYGPVDRTILEVTVHPQEIMENVVDGAHFVQIHRATSYPHDMEVTVDGHRLRSVAKQTMTSSRGPFDGVVDSELWGLGIDVNRIVGAVDTFTLMTLTPVGRDHLHARLTVTAKVNGTNESLAAAARQMVVTEFENDCVIWNNKRYEPSPALAAVERGITQFRTWARQFYAES